MKMKELRHMSGKELTKLLAETSERVRSLRFAAHGEGLSKVRELRKAKLTVSRVLTLLNEKDRQLSN